MKALQRISSCKRENSFVYHEKSFTVTWYVYITYETQVVNVLNEMPM